MLVSKAHILLHHSTLGSSVIKKKKKRRGGRPTGALSTLHCPAQLCRRWVSSSQVPEMCMALCLRKKHCRHASSSWHTERPCSEICPSAPAPLSSSAGDVQGAVARGAEQGRGEPCGAFQTSFYSQYTPLSLATYLRLFHPTQSRIFLKEKNPREGVRWATASLARNRAFLSHLLTALQTGCLAN